jgi:acyl carrier protein
MAETLGTNSDVDQGPQAVDVDSLISLFAEVLGVPQVEPDSDFFESGGDSRLVLRLVSRVRTRFRLAVTISDVLDNPTPAGLAALLRGPSSRPPLSGGPPATVPSV